MDRRSAMFLTMLLGGLVPRSLLGQTPRKGTSTKGRSRGRVALQPVKQRDPADDDPLEADDTTPAEGAEEADPNLPPEPGQQWRKFDIAHYTSLDHGHNNPQNAIVEWILRRTGSAPWHGDKIAVLSASRTQLRAYNSANVLKQVADVVDRFIDAQHDLLSLDVHFVAAADTRWRYAAYSRLTPVGSGPQGQQIWTLKVEDAAFVRNQMEIHQGFKRLAHEKVTIVNGQTLTVKTTEKRGYAGGLQRESAAGLGIQPKAEELEEGVTLRISPLLAYDGDMLEAAIDLTTNTVKNYHRTRVIAPREIGSSEITLDVPEVAESRLARTVQNWPLGQTLLISAGIQPGILLPNKAGFLNLRIPGTMPSGTELLVFIDAEAVNRGRSTREKD